MELQLQNPSWDRIIEKISNLAVIFLGLNTVFFILLVYYIIILNSDIGLSIIDPRFGQPNGYFIGCFTCDIDQYILPSFWYQFLVYLVPVFLGYFLSYLLAKRLHHSQKLHHEKIRLVLSSKIWLVIAILIPAFLVFFSSLFNFSLIYDGFTEGSTLRIDVVVIILLAIYSFLITNINCYRFEDKPEIGTLHQLMEAAKRSSPATFVYFFYVVILTNLPYFPRLYITHLLRFGFQSPFRIANLDRVSLWSGLLVISVFIILPLIFLSLFEIFFTPDTDTYQHLLQRKVVNLQKSYNTPLMVFAIALILFGLYHRAIFNLYDIGSISGSLRQKLTSILYNPYFVDINAKDQPPSSAHIFGTDYLGRDVYSKVMFGLGNTIIYGLYIVLGRLVFAFGYIKLKDRLSYRVDYLIQSIFVQIPRVLILLLLGRIIDLYLRLYQFNNQLLYLFALILTFSVFFWGDLAESIRGSVSLNSGHSRSDWAMIIFKFFSLALAMVFVELIFVGNYFLNAATILGTDLSGALQNYPTRYTWAWFYPIMVMVVGYLIFHLVGNYLMVDNTGDKESVKEYLYPDQADKEIDVKPAKSQ